LSVSAKDKGTNKEQSIRIEASTGLSKEEIDRMKNEALVNADADRITLEKVTKLNEVDSLIFQAEKQIKETNPQYLTEDIKTNLNDLLTQLRSAHSEQRMDELEPLMNSINDIMQNVSKVMYENANNQTPENGASATDIEYEEVTSK